VGGPAQQSAVSEQHRHRHDTSTVFQWNCPAHPEGVSDAHLHESDEGAPLKLGKLQMPLSKIQ
jgi:hypothetical protein